MTLQSLLDQFRLTRILKTDSQTKLLAVLGKINEDDAIVSFEKTAFSVADDVDITSLVEQLELIQNNDIYFWSLGTLSQDIKTNPGVKVNLIYPATDSHIRKYASQAHHLVKESQEDYESIVKPFIETQKGERIQWVYNILFHGKESESFVYHEKDAESGFVLLPDMKWDRQTIEAMYLITIVNRTDISSVRDLNGSHVEYLESLRAKIKLVTSEKYGLPGDQLRLFVHYQPSYYHFHIHVVNVSHPGLGDGLNVGKAILLDDVIENIKLVPDYYQKRTLYYVLGENHKLWRLLGQ